MTGSGTTFYGAELISAQSSVGPGRILDMAGRVLGHAPHLQLQAGSIRYAQS